MKPEDIKSIVVALSAEIEARIVESVYEQTKHKDREVSALHRQINDRLGILTNDVQDFKATLNSHDEVITELRSLYKTSGMVKKAIMWVLISVPMVSAFVAAVKYIYETLK